ncbi:peptidase [Galdieria sulphuraria]|uniref:Ubiquitin thioesterase OTU n=1 Tax=Galdieria sulphuraria TaxID=130081 RepID=M2XJI8_GALSU|nr:peptidase [Galdieria sulphuraria]EME30282.1 peptidase [Galdieria sulphuraria]|eukprot:XP_005706802.1 peptidase [Galdieria sulphuraria]
MWNKVVGKQCNLTLFLPQHSPCWTLPPFPFGHSPSKFWFASASERNRRRLRKVSVKGDGRCLFRAIAKCLAHNEGRALPERLEVADADALRKEAHKIICIEQREKFEKSMIIEGNLRRYCQELLKPSFYGGEPEIWVLSEVFQVPIQVYLQTENGEYKKIVEYGKSFWNKKEGGGVLPIRLLYNGVNHYDALLDY